MIIISSNLIINFINFCVIGNFLTKLQTDILFSTAVRAVLLAKLVILGILFLISFILALRIVLVAKLVISGILSSILPLYTSIYYIHYIHLF